MSAETPIPSEQAAATQQLISVLLDKGANVTEIQDILIAAKDAGALGADSIPYCGAAGEEREAQWNTIYPGIMT